MTYNVNIILTVILLGCCLLAKDIVYQSPLGKQIASGIYHHADDTEPQDNKEQNEKTESDESKFHFQKQNLAGLFMSLSSCFFDNQNKLHSFCFEINSPPPERG